MGSIKKETNDKKENNQLQIIFKETQLLLFSVDSLTLWELLFVFLLEQFCNQTKCPPLLCRRGGERSQRRSKCGQTKQSESFGGRRDGVYLCVFFIYIIDELTLFRIRYGRVA